MRGVVQMGVDARSSDTASRIACRLAEQTGVEIVPLDSPSACHAAELLLRDVWQAPPDEPPVTAHLLRALAFTGGYAFGAADVTGGLLAVAAGFMTAGTSWELHSHITGVLPEARDLSLGFVIKQHQRAWALERGVDVITWTCDPLVRRNMWFNLSKLGAEVSAYLPDFYGPMNDALNAGEPSDRALVTWSLLAPRAGAAAAGDRQVARVDHADVVLVAGEEGAPRPLLAAPASRALVVALPADIEALRRRAPAIAGAWRHALREVLAPRLSTGWSVSGICPAGLLLERA